MTVSDPLSSPTPTTREAAWAESIPQRAERIARDHNISPKEARRIAFAESRMERAKATRRAAQ